jgi:hypothetical protein
MRAMCSITRAPILIRRSRIVANSLEGSRPARRASARTRQCGERAAPDWQSRFMSASSDFKGLPLQTSPKVHSEPKGLFPAVTNTPRLATSAPFQRPTKENAGRRKHGCRGAAVRVAAGDLSVAVLRRATTAQPSHPPDPGNERRHDMRNRRCSQRRRR